MKNKTKSASGAKCMSITSTLKCALVGEHQVHSNSTKTKGQRATWKLTDDGRYEVTTFSSSGAKMGQWFDDAPPQPAIAPKSNLCGVRWERGADGSRIAKEDQIACGRDPGHDGKHKGFKGAHVSEWEGNGSSGGIHMPTGITEPVSVGYHVVGETEVAVRPLTKIGEYSVHPAAALFPMINATKWPAFVDDIRENGQREKIVRVLVDGLWVILDGRNRLSACLEIGVEPKFREFGEESSDGDDPIAFVTSVNVQRRHLDETELAYIGLELVPMYEKQAKERQRAGVTATLREGDKGTAAEHAARAVGISARSMESALRVKRDADPELLEASRDRGQMAVSAAAELAKLPKDKQREQLAKADGRKITLGKARSIVNQERKRDVVRSINEQQVDTMPEGPFRLIVCDWPWLYDNSDQHEGSRGHIPYPGMSTDEALAMAPKLDELAHEDGCILGFWTTNAFMPDAVRIVEAWGFTWRTIRTWDKGRDGIGTWCRSRTEHLIIAERGDVEHTLNEVSTLIAEARREHSRKPEEPMAAFEKHCPGPMLEMFAREPRSGWARWGAETEKFATEAA